jgi:hypothetical protein
MARKSVSGIQSKLLFITNLEQLQTRFGAGCVKKINTLIHPHELYDLQMRDLHNIGEYNWAKYSKDLRQNGIQGIIILGGYSIVPALRIDTLNNQQTAFRYNDRKDDFSVWNDDCYGNLDWNQQVFSYQPEIHPWFPDLPVSRIPDCDDCTFLINALLNVYTNHDSLGAIFCQTRPHVESIIHSVFAHPTTWKFQSAPKKAIDLTDYIEMGLIKQQRLYVQLHGEDTDGRTQWGENIRYAPLEMLEIAHAISIINKGSVVLSGSCWAALIVHELANHGVHVTPKGINDLIALKFLEQGASAFVGSTGSHTSPGSTDDWKVFGFGAAMQWYFWQFIKANLSPARALHAAKIRYRMLINQHPNPDLHQAALAQKILWEYTCLGLGW